MKSLNSKLNIIYGRILYKFPLESNIELFSSLNIIENFHLQKNILELENSVLKVKYFFSIDEDIKKYFFWKLGILGAQIYKLKDYLLASKIYKLIVKITSSDPKKYWIFSKISKEYQLVDALSKDKKICETLKDPLYSYTINIKENNYFNLLKKECDNLTIKELKKRIKSINQLKNKYYTIYIYKKDLYSDIYSLYSSQIKILELKKQNKLKNLFKTLFK